MSYSVIPTLNTTGVRHYYRVGLGGVGQAWLGLGSAPDFDTLSELQDAGWDPSRLQILVQLGATNEQLLALPYGPGTTDDDMTSAYNALALQLSSQPPSTQSPQPGPAPSSSPGSFLQAGSQLSYTASWGRWGVLSSGALWNDPNAIQTQIAPVLANQWGIVIDSQFHTSSDVINLSGKSGFTLQVHTTRDYGTAGDVKSIIDGALANLGAALDSSSIALTVTGVTPVVTGAAPGVIPSALATTAAPGQSPTGTNWNVWLQQNMGFLIFGLAVIVVIPPLLRKR